MTMRTTATGENHDPGPLPTREVPDNDHIWQELTQLAASLHAFRARVHARQAKFAGAADELTEIRERCDTMLAELPARAGDKPS